MRRDHNFPVHRGFGRLWIWGGLVGILLAGTLLLTWDGDSRSSRRPDTDQQALIAQIGSLQSQIRKLDSRVGDLELQIDTLKRTSNYETLDGTKLPSIPDPLDDGSDQPPTTAAPPR